MNTHLLIKINRNFLNFRRSIQSAFDGGGSNHTLKIPSNLIGKYGPQYSDMLSIDDGAFNFKPNSSPKHISIEKNCLISENSRGDELIDDNENTAKENKDNAHESVVAGKDFPRSEGINTSESRSLFDQVEDAVSRAKFLAAQQFILQNFQKQREVLMAATTVQNPSISPNEDNKKLFTHFPFNPLPFSVSSTPLSQYQCFTNMSQANCTTTDSLTNEPKSKLKEMETDTQDKDETDQAKHAENAFLLFSQIQNYRRHLLSSGIPKMPIGSLDLNPIRQCDKVIARY